MTRDQIRPRLTDAMAVAVTIFGEARDQLVDGQIAVGNVIRNRVRSHVRWWGTGWTGVCLAPAQFSCWSGVGADVDLTWALAEALVTTQPQGLQSVVSQIQWIAEGLIADLLRDNTSGADSYLTAALYRAGPPSWATRTPPVCTIGAHMFWRVNT